MEDNGYKNQPNYLLAGLILVQLLFFIIIGVVVSNIVKSDDVTFDSITKPFARVSGLPEFFTDEEVITVGSVLHSLMLRNNDEKAFSNSDTDTFINEDSENYFHFEDKGFTLYSAVLEAPTIGQSYKMFYGYSDGENDVFQDFMEFICIKAPTDSCVSSSEKTERDFVREFLQYVRFDRFTVLVSDKELTTIDINPIKLFDGDKNLEASYIDEVKTTIDAMGFSPELFSYRVLRPEDFTYEIDGY